MFFWRGILTQFVKNVLQNQDKAEMKNVQIIRSRVKFETGIKQGMIESSLLGCLCFIRC